MNEGLSILSVRQSDSHGRQSERPSHKEREREREKSPVAA